MPPAIRLIEAADLDTWQRVLLTLCLPRVDAEQVTTAEAVVDAPLVVVPNRAAAEQWRRTLEQRVLVECWTPAPALQQALEHTVGNAPGALTLPRLVTREELYDTCHRAARLQTPRLSALTREVVMGASARQAARSHRPPFLLRPGLIAEMLRLFDDIGRLGREPTTWLTEAGDHLAEEAPADRGAERLLQQTAFLLEAFRTFEARMASVAGLDERALRTALRQTRERWAPRHVVVTVGDHHAQREGLWPVDLALLAGAPGLDRLDVVATSRSAAALFARLRRPWPAASDVRVPSQQASQTQLEVTSAERRWIACRDRDEEVIAYARRLKTIGADPSTCALVYRRPLPYLYAAQHVMAAAGIPYQSSATLPLAAEPWAAALDLLMDAALSGFTRGALVTLLRSPHVRFVRPDGVDVAAGDIAALDTWLARHRYLGTLDHLDHLVAAPPLPPPSPSRRPGGRMQADWEEDVAARAVVAALRTWLARLEPLQVVRPSAEHVRAIREAWDACECVPRDDDPEASRTRRTRSAVRLLLEQLEETLAVHDPTPVPARETCILVRRWIEARTFALSRTDSGVHLVDADAAPYGLFTHVRIVGLLEGEWPEPSARDIFYPAFLLDRLGWAEECTRTAALRARLAELLTLPTRSVGVSVPELDQDAVVRPSSLLDELQAFGSDRWCSLPRELGGLPVTSDDALLMTQPCPEAPVLNDQAKVWAAWRLARPQRDTSGQTAPLPGDRYSVTGVETYLQCPFQYFASRVLGLQEEAEDEPGLPAREAGLFLHGVLHDCFAEWERLGHTTVRAEHLPRARKVFGDVAERALQALPPADRAIERVRLFGSAVATGVLEKMLRVEVEAFGDVARRALEHDIDQSVALPFDGRTRAVHLRGRVDRIDWTTDGRIRVVDYKTGRRPSQPLQPGVYAHAVVQQERAKGRHVGIAPSGFIAFREDAPWVQSVAGEKGADAQAESFVAAVEQIEMGMFPVRPLNEFRCQFCDYAGVCRKDYVGDE